MKIKNQKGLLKDMNTIQQSADLKNMLTLIEKTYEKVDLLWEIKNMESPLKQENLFQHTVLM